MNNKLCAMLGIDFPLFAFSHCRDVVVAVSKAGGFGVFGAAAMDTAQMKVELDWIDAHIDGKPYGLDLAIPENMGNRDDTHQTLHTLLAQIPDTHKQFMDEVLTSHGVNTATPVRADEDRGISHFLDTAMEQVEEGLRHPIRLFVNALGLPPKFFIEKSKAAGVPTGALVGSREHALRQIEAGIDVIVAQGNEAGAHCGEVSTMVLLPEVVRTLRASGSDAPVLAAGGIATGQQMAAAMLMGADGAWTGSAWLPSTESSVHPAVKQRLIAARSRDTIRSRAMTGKTARQLKSDWNAAWEGKDSPGFLPMPYQHILTDRALQLAEKSVDGGNEQARALLTEGVGQGIGLINEETSCRAIVQRYREEFADAMERFAEIAG
ncbi:nitronate monooxygenase [Novosphingobium lentum]|uniref:nitronate monooxygenase n=1 Tax=Novosphingobium lentum TaxID=145287 RepID=UPI000829AD52|nr:nitronate monooxygenase [Novosphingobium lentum]